MAVDFIKVAIERKDIAFFKHLLESYENLATVSTVDPKRAILKISIPKGNFDTVMDILENIHEVKFTLTEKGTF